MADCGESNSAAPTGGETSTGLGLNITEQLLNQMGGTISVAQNETQGSCFTLSLERWGTLGSA